jgi:dolichol-phosphate mannosyltransferase
VKTTIVVPCYDEADGIPKLIDELSPVAARLAADGPVELLFVDDGSRDDTARRLEQHAGWPVPVRVLRHERNLGLGAAVRTAFRPTATGSS